MPISTHYEERSQFVSNKRHSHISIDIKRSQMYSHLYRCPNVLLAEAARNSTSSSPASSTLLPTPASLRTNVVDAFVSANVSDRAADDHFLEQLIQEVQVRYHLVSFVVNICIRMYVFILIVCVEQGYARRPNGASQPFSLPTSKTITATKKRLFVLRQQVIKTSLANDAGPISLSADGVHVGVQRRAYFAVYAVCVSYNIAISTEFTKI